MTGVVRVAVVLGALALGGCSVERNATIYPSQDLAFSPGERGPSDAIAEAQSGRPLIGLDRSNWRGSALLVPSRRAWHRPTYASEVRIADSTARQRDEFPTAVTALELSEPAAKGQVFEALTAPLDSLGEVVLVPFRYFLNSGWYASRPGSQAYRKLPAPPEHPPSGLEPWEAKPPREAAAKLAK